MRLSRRPSTPLRIGLVALALALPAAFGAAGCADQVHVSEGAGTTGGGAGGSPTASNASTGAGGDASLDAPTDHAFDDASDAPADAPIDVSPDVVADAPPDVATDGPCVDDDHDGWTTCDGDCDDSNPLVNPGAYDFPNGIDDDCNGVIDDTMQECSQGLSYSSQAPGDYARAIEICQNTMAVEPLPNRRWGLISSELVLADGTGAPATEAHSIVTSFGTAMIPTHGPNMVMLSTGVAAVPGDGYWTASTPQPGTQSFAGSFTLPPGFPTNKDGCAIPADAAYDPVNLKLTIRVPTNAFSFAFDHAFFSAEYPEYACTTFNDMWVGLLTTTAPGIANNHNVIFDEQGTPASVNISFFDRCIAGPTGCVAGGAEGFNFCAGGTGDLAGTGFDTPDFQCNADTTIGGGTGWMTTEAPVTPGETMVLELIVWDSSDGIYDSVSIVDFFRWQQKSITNPVTHR